MVAGAQLLQYGKFEVIGGHEQAPFGDPLRSGTAKLRQEFMIARASSEGGLKGQEYLSQLLAGFMHELQAKVADSRL